MSMLGYVIVGILKLLVFWAGLVMPWGPVSGRNVGYFVIEHLLMNYFSMYGREPEVVM